MEPGITHFGSDLPIGRNLTLFSSQYLQQSLTEAIAHLAEEAPSAR